jgi:hypothetical protein
MSSIRNHRVVIASLFLPVTAALGDEPSIQPSPSALGGTIHRSPPPLSLDGSVGGTLPETPGRAQGALKNIIDDLSLKVSSYAATITCIEPSATSRPVFMAHMLQLHADETYTSLGAQRQCPRQHLATRPIPLASCLVHLRLLAPVFNVPVHLIA